MKETELLKLRQELEERKKEIGLIGTKLRVRTIKGNSLSAQISTDWKEIDISYGERLDLSPDEETKAYLRKRRILQSHGKVGEDLLEHEAGHRENKVGELFGCPFDLELHEEIKDSITRGLEQIDKKGLESYVTNVFEDIIDNINCRRHTDFAGQTLFWNNQGLVNSENGKYAPFYEAFVRINLMLGSNVSDYNLLKRFFNHEDKIKKAVSSFFDSFKRETGEAQLVRFHERDGFYRLFDYNKEKRKALWKTLGYEFAVHIGALLDKLPEQRMFGSSEEDENSDEQNPFDREMKIPGNKENFIYERYKQGKGPVAHRELEEQLYDLYRRISREIHVETSDYTESESMPIVHFGRKFIGYDERRIRFKGIGFDSDGDLRIKTTKHSLEYPMSYKKNPREFPKFKLAKIDRSGSMSLSPDNNEEIGDTSSIPWGDNSKYHYALKGYFGIENFFERQSIAGHIENCVLGFSGEKAVRGNSETVAKSLLVKPSGGTSLDIKGIESELEEGCLFISISDGEFSLDEKDKKRLERKLTNCDYAHIQVGNETDFSRYIRSLGRPVMVVKGDNDLSEAMISFVSNKYRSFKPARRTR